MSVESQLLKLRTEILELRTNFFKQLDALSQKLENLEQTIANSKPIIVTHVTDTTENCSQEIDLNMDYEQDGDSEVSNSVPSISALSQTTDEGSDSLKRTAQEAFEQNANGRGETYEDQQTAKKRKSISTTQPPLGPKIPTKKVEEIPVHQMEPRQPPSTQASDLNASNTAGFIPMISGGISAYINNHPLPSPSENTLETYHECFKGSAKQYAVVSQPSKSKEANVPEKKENDKHPSSNTGQANVVSQPKLNFMTWVAKLDCYRNLLTEFKSTKFEELQQKYATKTIDERKKQIQIDFRKFVESKGYKYTGDK